MAPSMVSPALSCTVALYVMVTARLSGMKKTSFLEFGSYDHVAPSICFPEAESAMRMLSMRRSSALPNVSVRVRALPLFSVCAPGLIFTV